MAKTGRPRGSKYTYGPDDRRKVGISLVNSAVEKLDAYADRKGVTRSKMIELMINALRDPNIR